MTHSTADMTDTHQVPGLDALTAEQRYELAMTLLDSVFAERIAGPTPPEHLAEIRRRVAEMEAAHLPGEPWQDVFDRILGRQ
ncbi:MAG: addiction module protein [Phycisphaerae bacterium]|jgi:putative addiction module component (TIGR02574 family)|nr:addiction module protein [Phycisphaerae bacterium]MCZ2400036.1 addiction module protein [Phycisphaerae bacterium]